MAVDFRKDPPPLDPLTILSNTIPTTFKFLQLVDAHQLSLEECLSFIIHWFTSATRQDKRRLQWTVQSVERIIGTNRPFYPQLVSLCPEQGNSRVTLPQTLYVHTCMLSCVVHYGYSLLWCFDLTKVARPEKTQRRLPCKPVCGSRFSFEQNSTKIITRVICQNGLCYFFLFFINFETK